MSPIIGGGSGLAKFLGKAPGGHVQEFAWMHGMHAVKGFRRSYPSESSVRAELFRF